MPLREISRICFHHRPVLMYWQWVWRTCFVRYFLWQFSTDSRPWQSSRTFSKEPQHVDHSNGDGRGERKTSSDYYYCYPSKWLMIWIRARTNRNKSFYCFDVICAVCSNSPWRFCAYFSLSILHLLFSVCFALNVVVTLLWYRGADGNVYCSATKIWKQKKAENRQRKMRKQRERLPSLPRDYQFGVFAPSFISAVLFLFGVHDNAVFTFYNIRRPV